MAAEGVGQKQWDGNFEVICDWKVLSTVGEGCDSKVVKAVHQQNGTTVWFFFCCWMLFVVLLLDVGCFLLDVVFYYDYWSFPCVFVSLFCS